MIITIGISCFALVLVMFMQFKIVNETDITSIENMREAELRTELANWKSKYEETNQKYEETTQKIEEYKQTSQSNEETEKLVDEELSQVNLSLGKTDVQGQGIEVTLRENESEEIARINGDDLLVIVNSLKMSGAEAISINDQRIVYDSYIADINEANRITVNGTRINAPPYIIKAIGNTTYLESAVSQKKYGYIDVKISEGKNVTLERQESITIPRYNKNLNFEYVKGEE